MLAHAGTANPMAITTANKTDVNFFIFVIFIIPLFPIIVHCLSKRKTDYIRMFSPPFAHRNGRQVFTVIVLSMVSHVPPE